MDSQQHFEDGRLGDAVDACAAELRKEPTNFPRRYFLAELLCFGGQWERADKQLETLAQQDPAHELQCTIFRQLIRAELARQDVFHRGRTPGFFAEPSTTATLHLRALVALREQQQDEATSLLTEAEANRPASSGRNNGNTTFDDFRDLDDVTASFFEILTAHGTYHWLPIELVTTADFVPPKRPRDVLWCPAHFELQGGQSIDGFVPALYVDTPANDDDQLKLGRATTWSESSGPVRGAGLRVYLVGDEDQTIFDLKRVHFGADG
jgi:type VI secretion system protein ImpE